MVEVGDAATQSHLVSREVASRSKDAVKAQAHQAPVQKPEASETSQASHPDLGTKIDVHA